MTDRRRRYSVTVVVCLVAISTVVMGTPLLGVEVGAALADETDGAKPDVDDGPGQSVDTPQAAPREPSDFDGTPISHYRRLDGEDTGVGFARM